MHTHVCFPIYLSSACLPIIAACPEYHPLFGSSREFRSFFLPPESRGITRVSRLIAIDTSFDLFAR